MCCFVKNFLLIWPEKQFNFMLQFLIWLLEIKLQLQYVTYDTWPVLAQAYISPLVQLYPGIQMVISLIHRVGEDAKRPQASNANSRAIVDDNYVLEHSLHQLLRQVHLNNVGQPAPHPSSAPLGPTKRRRLAGPQAHDRHELVLMAKR